MTIKYSTINIFAGLIFITFFASLPQFGQAATYYVAPSGNDTTGNGSISNPWKTITKGCGRSSSLSPGDTLYVREGIYYEVVETSKNLQATKENPTIIKAYPGETVTMDGTLPLTGWTQCNSNDSFLTVQGTVNPNYANIYWTFIHKDMIAIPAWPGASIPQPSTTMRPVMLLEDGVRCRIARYPNQTKTLGIDTHEPTCGVNPSGDDNTFIGTGYEATHPATSAYLRDNDGFKNKPTGYWNGAWIDVWTLSSNNNVERRIINSYTNESNIRTAYFNSPLQNGNISRDEVNNPPLRADGYSIVNHPHVLDTPGEFAMTTTPDANGYYKIYLWPENIANLNSRTSYAHKDYAFHLSFNNAIKYLTIDGFNIKGYNAGGVFIEGEAGDNNIHVGHVVQNCTITNTDGDGICANYANSMIVNNCTISNVINRCVTFGTGKDNLISDCTFSASWETNVSMWGQTNLQILRNKMYGSVGYHGHAITLYGVGNNTLVADNVMDTSSQSMAFHTQGNIVFYNNLILSDYEPFALATWSNGTGNLVFINNIILSSGSNAIAMTTSRKALLVNNVLSGTGINAKQGTTHVNNLYTKINTGIILNPNEIDGRGYLLTSLFAGPDNSNYRPCSNSPLLGSGTNITQLLIDWGVTSLFPDFDFTKDIAGDSRGTTPSIGTYQNVSGGSNPTSYTLNITAVNGIVTKKVSGVTTTATSFSVGTVVELTAVPNSGYNSTGWSGNASGTANPVTITMDANKAVTANFTQNTITTYTLSITTANGTVTKSPDKTSYTAGETVTLTATANTGYSFGSWTGDATGTTTPITITMNSNKTITANFIPFTPLSNLIAYWKLDETTGTQASDSSGNNHPASLVNSPVWTNGEGLLFDGVNDYLNIPDSDTLELTRPMSFSVWLRLASYTNFSKIFIKPYSSLADPWELYTIDLGSNGNSPRFIVTDGAPSGSIAIASNSQYTLSLNTWHHIVGTYNGSLITLYLNGNLIATQAATFTIGSNSIPLCIGGRLGSNTLNGYISDVRIYNGALSSTDTSAIYSNGRTTTPSTTLPVISTQPANRSATEGQTASFSVTATGSGTLTYQWQKNQTNITGATASTYTTPTLTASDNGSKYRCIVTNAGGFTNSNEATLTVMVTLSITATSGTVTKKVGGVATTATTFAAGTVVELTAATISGYTFSSWSGSITGTTNPITITMNGNKSVTANFTQITYTLAITATNGTVAKSPNTATYTYGQVVTLTATANTGYTFGSWSGSAIGTNNPITVTMNSNKTVTANFTATPYTLTITSANGTVANSPNAATYTYGQVVTLTATASTGYSFGSWTGDATGTTNPVTVTMNGNKAVTANFTALSLDLSITAHWMLDENTGTTAADSSSTGRTATLINNPSWGFAWASEDWISLDNQTQAISIPASALQPQAGAIALWIEPDSLSGTQFILGHVFNNSNRINLYSVAGKLALGLGSNIALQTNIADLIVGQPAHISLTWNGTAYAVYVNAVQKATGTFEGLAALNTTLDIGNYGDPANRTVGFVGVVEDIRTYCRALTATEIQRLYYTYDVFQQKALSFSVQAVDSNGLPVTYQLATTKPAGATFESGVFSWQPWYNQVGNYTLVFTATGQPIRVVTITVHETTLTPAYRQFLVDSGKLP